MPTDNPNPEVQIVRQILEKTRMGKLHWTLSGFSLFTEIDDIRAEFSLGGMSRGRWSKFVITQRGEVLVNIGNSKVSPLAGVFATTEADSATIEALDALVDELVLGPRRRQITDVLKKLSSI